MPRSNYTFEYDEFGNTKDIRVNASGLGVYDNNYTNKGTAFSEEEREVFDLVGTLPPTVRPLNEQVINSLRVVEEKGNNIERFVYVRSLFDRNVTLAHALIQSNIARFMEIIYTPTVGEACQHFSSMFRKANGLIFYPGNIDRAEDILRRFSHRQIRVAVVTDNRGVLGIGDQGVGGIAICLGKLMLYTQGAGIAPWHCLPISLDVGTDNEELRNSVNYLGWRHPRLAGSDYIKFVQQFAKAFKSVFPNALCQWEDFSKQDAFAVRDAFLHDLISFNDDIQGTGAVTLAAVLTAMKIKKESLADQVFLIHGAGAGGVGVAEQLETALIESGLSAAEARKRIFTVDSRGLVTTDRKLEPYKQKFAKNPEELSWSPANTGNILRDVIRNEKVTVLIGTSGQAGCFTKDIAEAMLANTEQPVILPLSNPTAITEARPQDLYEWTAGKVLVATGSPFEPATFSGKKYRISQCNNVFIFPGVGLGVLASGASEVLPSFFTAAAKAVSEMVSEKDMQAGHLLPSVEALRDVSQHVALSVGLAAIKEGISRPCAFSTFQHENDKDRLATLIDKMRWQPQYLPLIYEKG